MPIADPTWPRAATWLARESGDPQIVVVGVPASRSSLSPSRADLTPMALRERLGRFTTFHEEWEVDFGNVTVSDQGNWPVSELDRRQMPPAVMNLASELPDAPLTVYLGGDNAITRPLVSSLEPDLSRVGVITFDAHHDVRSLDHGPTNGNPIRGLIEEDGLAGEHIVQIGIHSFANPASYRTYCDEKSVKVITVEQIEREGIVSAVEGSLARLDAICDVIYVDVDIDVLDRAFAPGSPGARPGGLTVRQLAAGVRTSSRHPKVMYMDLVEVDVELDRDGLTLDATAHVLLSAFAGYAER